jgi:hypothetical protein
MLRISGLHHLTMQIAARRWLRQRASFFFAFQGFGIAA